jgi:hypothetical protein
VYFPLTGETDDLSIPELCNVCSLYPTCIVAAQSCICRPPLVETRHRGFRGFLQPSETRSNGWRVTHVDFMWRHARQIISSSYCQLLSGSTARVSVLSTLTVHNRLVRRLGGVKTRKARAVSHHFTLHFHMQRRYGNARYGTVTNGKHIETLDFTVTAHNNRTTSSSQLLQSTSLWHDSP